MTAVRGNNDKGAWAEAIAETEVLRIGDVFIHALHDIAQLNVNPAVAGFQVVVCGHSHKALVEQRDGVLHVNPGSAGPRRFKLPVSVAELVIVGGLVEARLVELNIA